MYSAVVIASQKRWKVFNIHWLLDYDLFKLLNQRILIFLVLGWAERDVSSVSIPH